MLTAYCHKHIIFPEHIIFPTREVYQVLVSSGTSHLDMEHSRGWSIYSNPSLSWGQTNTVWLKAFTTHTHTHTCVHAQLLQSCLTLCGPMDCSLPGFSVPGILQVRILGVGSHYLLQGIWRQMLYHLSQQRSPENPFKSVLKRQTTDYKNE